MSMSVPDDPIYPSARSKASLEEMIRAKGVRPIKNIEDLAADIWESDEELDEFLAFVYTERHRDLA